MQKLLQTTTAVASLLLAGLPVVGFAQAAHAQDKVVVTADVAAFATRVDHAANAFCGRQYRPNELAATAACREAVWAEVTAKLSPAQAAATIAARDDARAAHRS